MIGQTFKLQSSAPIVGQEIMASIGRRQGWGQSGRMGGDSLIREMKRVSAWALGIRFGRRESLDARRGEKKGSGTPWFGRLFASGIGIPVMLGWEKVGEERRRNRVFLLYNSEISSF